MFTYKIEDKKEGVDLDRQTIVKTGEEVKKIKVKFTLKQVDKQIADYEKIIKEKTAQAKIHEAEMGNVILNHPEVSSIDEKLQQAVFVYVNSKMEKSVNEETAKAYQDAVKDLTEEKEEILKQING